MIISVLGDGKCCFLWACVWILAFIPIIFCALCDVSWIRSEPSFCTSGLVLRRLQSLTQDILLLRKGGNY